jgi:hypothetical protein
MDVVHVLCPIVARTRTDPKPRRSPPARSRISSDSLAGRLTKVQVSARRASHSHSSALKTTFTDLACHASLAPQASLCGRQGPGDSPQPGAVHRQDRHAAAAARMSIAIPVSRSETSHSAAIALSMPSLRTIGLRTGGPLLTNSGP